MYKFVPYVYRENNNRKKYIRNKEEVMLVGISDLQSHIWREWSFAIH